MYIPAQAGGDGALDRGNITKIAAHTCAQELIVTGSAEVSEISIRRQISHGFITN